ncbi:SusC/RagA family TonB-linked outer membrane protein [Ferruginibacter profundus]
MKKIIPHFLRIIPQTIALLCLSVVAFAQTAVTGKVTDSKDGTPVSGVTVAVKGTTTATKTAADGTFKINAASTATLMFTSVGFAALEVPVAGKTSLEISLVQADQRLNEVVVVAYGTKRRGDLTGSVTAISAKDFQKGNINSSEQLLVGKVAGLEVTTGGGSAGGGSKIRIRSGASLNASNDPLIVIDGVPVEGNGIAGSGNYLNTINPNDIESISVLKDASATSLYGSRASNGVVIITTKKGSKGKVKYNFNTQSSVANVAQTVDVLSGDQIRSIINADAAATGNNTYKNLLGTANTDWQKQIYRAAFGNDNNISASGNIAGLPFDLPFRASLGYLNQAGILKTNKFGRVSTSLNLSPKLWNDHLSVNVAFKYSHTNNQWANEGAIGSAVSFDPTQPVYTTGGKYGGYYEWLQPDGKPIDLATRNPLALLELRDNTSDVNRVIGNVQIDYKMHFLPDLHLLVNLGIDNAGGKGNDNTDSLSATVYKTGGSKSYYEQKKKNTLADVQLFYSKEVKSIKSKIDVLVGHSYQDFVTEVKNFASFSYRAISNPAKPALKDTLEGSQPTFLTDKPEYRLESYIGRLNYTFNNKYLLTASLRRDASSKFAKENRVGYFPSVAVAWKMKEDFFAHSNVVSDLKLRLSWGETGQQDGIPYYSYLPYYSQSNASAQYQFGNTYYSFLRPSAYDKDRKWESTTTSNIGMDFGFLNNRISGSVDVYQKKTKDLLSVIPVAPGSNFDITLFTNVGNMENKGIEFSLNTIPIAKRDLTWNFGFNVTYNQSKITNLQKFPDPNFKGIDVSSIGGGLTNYIGKFAVGYSPYVFNVYKQVYDKTTGAPIENLFEDLNRDGQITEADRYLYKKPAADILFGINTQVTYKKWNFGLASHGALGNYLYNQFNSNNGVLRALKNPINFIQNGAPDYMATKFSGTSTNEYLSDYYIENASYLKLDNINIGYNFGKIIHNKASLRVSGSVQNVFTITKYSGLDPENASSSGVDYTIYPRPRIYSVGASLDF